MAATNPVPVGGAPCGWGDPADSRDSMRLAFLRRADDPADEEASVLADATRPLAPTLVSDAALETILARRAAGEPSAAGELRRWQGNRLLTTLERILGDPRVASRVMDTLLADILSHAGAHRATGATAEDWLFARLRFQVREAAAAGQRWLATACRPTSAGGDHAAAA